MARIASIPIAARFRLAHDSDRIGVDSCGTAHRRTNTRRGQRMLLDINGIQKILPHRSPFLLVDAIEEMERWKRIVGIKNVTINENYFQGHFPGQAHHAGRADHRIDGADGRACCCCRKWRTAKKSCSTSSPSITRASAGR